MWRRLAKPTFGRVPVWHVVRDSLDSLACSDSGFPAFTAEVDDNLACDEKKAMD